MCVCVFVCTIFCVINHTKFNHIEHYFLRMRGNPDKQSATFLTGLEGASGFFSMLTHRATQRGNQA